LDSYAIIYKLYLFNLKHLENLSQQIKLKNQMRVNS